MDGSLVFVGPQEKWHSFVLRMVENELDKQARDALRAVQRMAVVLGARQVPEPDVLVVTAEAFERDEPSTYYVPEDVVLVVEAVSPESVDRDRDTKPRKYAAAGIRHFWRLENEGGETAAYVYELGSATGVYALTGIYRGVLKVTVPFDIEIDLATVGRRARY
ncbi:Uma2 family endonuclease [Actinomadura litoris]|uniref:Uma2 family endonuclease n=1 Tax=Actinomadura litoris TaxID=2678616 RepID=UPI0028A62E6A|nr:Uma2 family endonuclease [Actinomadura litoris]